jgi:hypothetical protein
MGALDWLTQPSTPPSVNSTSSSVGQLPPWLQNFEQGVAGKALSIANQGYIPYPGQRLAGFTPDQQRAFSTIEGAQGNWQPELNQASSIASGIYPSAMGGVGAGQQYGSNAVYGVNSGVNNANRLAQGGGAAAMSSVAGPAQTWGNNWQQYMSPYTQSVVNEIGRLGNRNLMENILPNVQSQFIGSGQFGSSRNADILGRAVRDTQDDITGKQQQALESGYGTAAGIFGQDASRQQQQQQMQSQAALGAGQLGANTALSGAGQIGSTNLGAGNLATSGAQTGANIGLGAAGQLGGLAQMRQGMTSNDAAALGSAGQMQQNLQQQGLDIGYQDFLNQRDWDRNNLNWMTGLIRGIPMQQSVTQSSNAPLPGAAYGPSGLSYVNSGLGLWNAISNGGNNFASNNAGVLTSNPGLSLSDLYGAA